MGHIYVKTIPNCVPITTGGSIHYCVLEFVIYKSEQSLPENGMITDHRPIEGNIKKGPMVTITAKTAPPDCRNSEEALCMTNDIPSAGYAYAHPEGWGCSHSVDAAAGTISFQFRPPVAREEEFKTAVIGINSFFTTAQESACDLHVRIENFHVLDPDVEDSAFTITISKKYDLEIRSFTANDLTGKFFFNHNLPVLLRWDAVCDIDTPLKLLEDNIVICAVQEFTGEKLLETRDVGNHIYTLKMILSTGEKTESIMIKDTRWVNAKTPSGLTPDFSRQGHFLSNTKEIYLFYDNRLYQSKIAQDGTWSDWAEICVYDGSVIYHGAACAISEDAFYLIGGTKEGSDTLFYSVYDLKCKEGWTDHDMLQPKELEGGVAAGNDFGPQWILYAKQKDEYVVFNEYDPETKNFSGKYGLKIPGMKFMDICIRKNVLYLAAATDQGILLKNLEKGESVFSDAGIIETGRIPGWMKWVWGCNDMFLWTEEGLYREKDWMKAESFQPPYREGTYPWCGGHGGKLVSLLAGEKDGFQAWITDVLI